MSNDTISKFDNITPKDVILYVNPVTMRIMAHVMVDSEWHEVAFPKDSSALNMQYILDAVKEDLRAKLNPANATEGDEL